MDFDHRAHVRFAWEQTTRHGLPTAFVTVPAFLRGVAFGAGVPDRYHETVTLAFVLLVADRIGDEGTFDEFAAHNASLFEPDAISRYFKPATLGTDRARRRFVFPDRNV